MNTNTKLAAMFGTLLFMAFALMQVTATFEAMKNADDVKEALEPVIEAQPKAFDLREDPVAAAEPEPEKPDPRLAAQPRKVTFFLESGRELDKDASLALIRPKQLVKARDVRLDSQFDARDLLGEGEVLPQSDLLNLFARVRATRLADAECADILASFASECQVKSYEVKRGEGTVYHMSTRLLFVQKTAPGPMPDTPAVLVVEERVRSDRVAYDPTDPEAYLAVRRDFLSDVEAACDVVRSSLGNCYLADVRVSNSVREDKAYATRLITMNATLPLDLGGSN